MKAVRILDDLIELLDRSLIENLVRCSQILPAEMSERAKQGARREASWACDAEECFEVRATGPRNASHVTGAASEKPTQQNVAAIMLRDRILRYVPRT